MNRLYRLGACLLLLSSSILIAQTPPAAESGKFRLHKFEQPIGEESYTITPDGKTLTLKTDFKFTDRGTASPVASDATHVGQLCAAELRHQGQNLAHVGDRNRSHHQNGANATIRQGKETRTFAGSADVLHHLRLRAGGGADGDDALLARARAAGADGDAAIGTVRIQDRGSEIMQVNGRDVQVERYTVQGLIWGMETLWMDDANNLAALVSTDAEFDHFEAVRR